MTKVMVTVCMVVFVGIFLLPCGTMAFNQAQLDQLKATQKCPDCDLSGANLTGANLFTANLTEANLTEANLNRANLDHANLSGATLSGANLSSADLTGANLTGAKLFTAIWTDESKCKSGSIGKCIK
jgi:uncharacterized protein YjbI with pentapeptide repeats